MTDLTRFGYSEEMRRSEDADDGADDDDEFEEVLAEPEAGEA